MPQSRGTLVAAVEGDGPDRGVAKTNGCWNSPENSNPPDSVLPPRATTREETAEIAFDSRKMKTTMQHRRRAREIALQLLFQRDVNPNPMSPETARQFALDRLPRDGEGATFAVHLADGVEAARRPIDQLIGTTAANWRLHRMTPVDRNLLRLATYEMKFAAETVAPAIAINEAVDLARQYGTTDSPAFVNGILDAIAKSSVPSAAGTAPA
jgi:N utilization substance protein B